MAVTQGHGNPDWTEDEIVLALDLYFALKGKIPGSHDSAVIELSEFLRSFPYHSAAARKPSFRNPDGVAFKLQNLRQIATGNGLGNTSKTDKAVWEHYGKNPEAVQRRAALIRQAVLAENKSRLEDEEDVFAEGRAVTSAHKRRERSKKLRQGLLKKRVESQSLCCDVCGYRNTTGDPRFDDAGLEAHHLRPLSEVGETNTKLTDVALLCATCHRLTHRAISVEKRWLSLEQIRILLRSKIPISPC